MLAPITTMLPDALLTWSNEGRVGASSASLLLISLLGCLLLSWRLWMFTILPLLRPDEPKEIPYWVPCLPNLTPYIAMSVLH